jgi:hypothetical protein
MARQLRQSHHYTGDMRLRVSKQHADTYKCQRGDQHFHSHHELRSEHPQSTIRMKRGIVSRYLRLPGETRNTDNARRVRVRHVRRRIVCRSAKGCRRAYTAPGRPIARKQRSHWSGHSHHQAILPRGENERSKRESPVGLND